VGQTTSSRWATPVRIAHRSEYSVVLDAFAAAVEATPPLQCCIRHMDRGSQSCSPTYHKLFR